MDIYTFWPFPCLVVGVVMCANQLRPLFQSSSSTDISTLPSRFFTRLALPFYMLHQFEEHGYDLLGRRFHFIVFSCEDLMTVSLANCPMTPQMVFYINVFTVWGTGLAAYFDEKGSGAGANFLALQLINALVHFSGSARTGIFYNPGAATGAVLFLPIALLGFRALLRERKTDAMGIARAIAVGALSQAVIMSSFGLIAGGFISEGTACFLQVLNILPTILITKP